MLWFLLSLIAFMVMAIAWTLFEASLTPRPVAVAGPALSRRPSLNFAAIASGLSSLSLGVLGVALWVADSQHFSPRANYCRSYEYATGHGTASCSVDEFFDSLKVLFSVGGVLLVVSGIGLLAAGILGRRGA